MTVERIRVRGKAFTLDAQEAVSRFEASLSTEETAQFSIIFEDEDDYLLKSRFFALGGLFEIASTTDLDTLVLEVAVEESSEGPTGGILSVVARAKGVQALKKIRGPLRLQNMTHSQFVERMAKQAGLKTVIQPTAQKDPLVGMDGPKGGQRAESAWDKIKDYAQKNGYIVFEAANTLYFGKPTWLITRLPGTLLDVSSIEKRPEQIQARPTCRRSADDENSPVTITFQTTDFYAEFYRPGRALMLKGMPSFDGIYLITQSTWDEDGDGTITAQTPVDPIVDVVATDAQKGVAAPNIAADGSGGGEINMDAFLYGLRMHESGGNYRAESRISTASGAYQYIDGTWNNYGGVHHAANAPASVQDARARADAQAAYNKYNGDWEKVAAHHFYPAWANDKSKWGQSPSPGNPTVRQYVDSVLGKARAKAGVTGAPRSGADIKWMWPTVSQRTTSEFGMRVHPITGERKLHAGLDIGVPTGTSVFASAAGKVIHAGAASGYGIAVYIDHGGTITRYGHLSKVNCAVGQKVVQGQIIAISGATGGVTGPHLHFEIRPNDVPQNPRNFLPKAGGG